MILLDANVLLYAYNASFTQHGRIRAWLEPLLAGGGPVALAWQSIMAFLRIGTNPRAFPEPLMVEEALTIMQEWLGHPNVVVLQPTERHWGIFTRLVHAGRLRAGRMMDAHLAALAVEHGAVLGTTDTGFRVFADLRLVNPLDEPSFPA